MNKPLLTITGLNAQPVNVPITRPLITAGGSITHAPLILIDLMTDGGVTGRSYLFVYAPMALLPITELLKSMGEMIKGQSLIPKDVFDFMQKKFTLLGLQGFSMMAVSGVDMACWDAAARADNLPLCQYLGHKPVPIPAYNSTGLGLIGADAAATEALELVDAGFTAIKLRLGYQDGKTDAEVCKAVRDAVGPDIHIMADYNQSLSVKEALSRVHNLEHSGLYWIEEPVAFDNYVGCAQIRKASHIPIQIGENCWGPNDMLKAIEAKSCSFFMPDAMKIGGVTGWLKAAKLAEQTMLPLSSHLFPEISAHLLTISSTRHWLEYIDFAKPILKHPLKVAKNGTVTPSSRAGIGLEWDPHSVDQFLYT